MEVVFPSQKKCSAPIFIDAELAKPGQESESRFLSVTRKTVDIMIERYKNGSCSPYRQNRHKRRGHISPDEKPGKRKRTIHTRGYFFRQPEGCSREMQPSD